MNIEIVQGDQIIRKLSKPITGELESACNLVIAGSHSSPHTIKGKCRTRMVGDRRIVRIDHATTIEHADRHRTTAIARGWYEIYPQRERGGEGDRAVED